ncbi:MAG TPA: thiamine pyrophosphate-dependent enzyme, partial [Bryobacteraceae bacterium]|nr:thiamine pyrophosphate-dependent enzyme [Bryobacteraceae bacterium]
RHRLFRAAWIRWLPPIHAARRNMDIMVVCVNNMIYAMTGGQAAATTPGAATSTTTPYGSFEPELNIPQLVDASGACFVARWTAFHVKQLERSMTEALKKKGFRFIEVLSPCPTLYGRRNGYADGLAQMKEYKEMTKVKNGAPTYEVAIVPHQPIIVGKFVDRERPDYLTLMRSQLGANYHEMAATGTGGGDDSEGKEGCCSC